MLFQCELIKDDIIKKRLFREGNTAKEVKEGLELFDFGSGKWRVFPPEHLDIMDMIEDN